MKNNYQIIAIPTCTIFLQFLCNYLDYVYFEIHSDFDCYISYGGLFSCKFKSMESSHYIEHCNNDLFCLAIWLTGCLN